MQSRAGIGNSCLIRPESATLCFDDVLPLRNGVNQCEEKTILELHGERREHLLGLKMLKTDRYAVGELDSGCFKLVSNFFNDAGRVSSLNFASSSKTHVSH